MTEIASETTAGTRSATLGVDPGADPLHRPRHVLARDPVLQEARDGGADIHLDSEATEGARLVDGVEFPAAVHLLQVVVVIGDEAPADPFLFRLELIPQPVRIASEQDL